MLASCTSCMFLTESLRARRKEHVAYGYLTTEHILARHMSVHIIIFQGLSILYSKELWFFCKEFLILHIEHRRCPMFYFCNSSLCCFQTIHEKHKLRNTFMKHHEHSCKTDWPNLRYLITEKELDQILRDIQVIWRRNREMVFSPPKGFRTSFRGVCSEFIQPFRKLLCLKH